MYLYGKHTMLKRYMQISCQGIGLFQSAYGMIRRDNLQPEGGPRRLMWQRYIHSAPAGTLPYFVYAPDNEQDGTPVPLVVMLHGCAQTAEEFAKSTRMNELAEQYHFIVAYPQQTSDNNRSHCWNWFKPTHQVRDHGEPAIIANIVREIAGNKTGWTIDPQHIYVAGLSAGGAMASILGATYPELFTAIGVHSGLEYGAASNMIEGLRAMRGGGPDALKLGYAAYTAMGAKARVMPVIVFHGSRDRVVHPMNGEKVVRQWMQTNSLASHGTYIPAFNAPMHVEAGYVKGGRKYTVYTWADTRGKPVQEYWQVDDMGHGWSGGRPGRYSDPRGPDASLAMYQFFLAHATGAQAKQDENEKERLNRWNIRAVGERLLRPFHSHTHE